MFLAQKNNALKYVLYPVPIMEERGDKFWSCEEQKNIFFSARLSAGSCQFYLFIVHQDS
jgi:hypothetical protein